MSASIQYHAMIVSDSLRNAIRYEGGFPLSEDIMDKLFSYATRKDLGKEEYIIKPSTVNKSIWITEKGVTKAVYNDGKKLQILGFSGPGTITMSPLSQVLGRPSFCGFQTITECVMLEIDKKNFDRLMMESHEFSRWMYGIMVSQFCALELKAQMLSEGDVTMNFKNMVKRQMKLDKDGFDPNRPDLLTLVSSKDLAAYLGITQSYLSNIRKALIEEERNKNKN